MEEGTASLPEIESGIDTLDPQEKVKAIEALEKLKRMEFQSFGDLMNRMEQLYIQKLKQLDQRIATVEGLAKELVELTEIWDEIVKTQMLLTKVMGTQVTIHMEDVGTTDPIPLRHV